MKFPRPLSSIAAKLVAASLIVEVAMLSLLLLSNVRTMEEHLASQTEVRLHEVAHLFEASLATPLAQQDYGALQGLLDTLRSEQAIEYLALFDRNGKMIAASGWPTNRPLPPMHHGRPSHGRNRYDTAVPVTLAGKTYGQLRFGVSTAFFAKARHSLLRTGIAIAAGEVLLSAVLLSLLGYWLTRRLRIVTRATEAIAGGQLNTRVEIAGEQDELTRLSRSFNLMAAALEARVGELNDSRQQLELAAKVFETTAEAVMVLDADFRIAAANPAFTAITGYRGEELAGRLPPFLEVSGSGAERLDEIRMSVRRDGRWDHEQWSHRKNGEAYAERLSITGISDQAGRVIQYVVAFSDITQRKRDEERIRYQANYDSLTGLPNRSLFMDRLSQAISIAQRTGQRVGLMYIDLDGFKEVNDTLGHDLGDELLKDAAMRLLSCVRQGDTVARLGGDEFTIVMPNLDQIKNVPLVARRIIEALEQPFRLGNHQAFISGSIGVTAFPDDASCLPDLLKNADSAMYRAKAQGKANFQFFTGQLNDEIRDRLDLKAGLSKAWEHQEFQIHYQPKCALKTGAWTGVEALLRWTSPDLGPIPPTRFVPVMEDTGLIGVVGEWVLETACRQYKSWRDAGHPDLPVAVNLSARQLRQGDLVRTIETILDRVGIEPAGIELDVTEGAIMRDPDRTLAVLTRLRDMGIHLAVDDFGTGYSSLRCLRQFPLDSIKIDRSFVSDIPSNPDDREIIRTIITMGHSLGRRIIAEGVETESQRSVLRDLGCDEMQGYLLSPAVPPGELDRMLAALPAKRD